jgi:hypothetical protein
VREMTTSVARQRRFYPYNEPYRIVGSDLRNFVTPLLCPIASIKCAGLMRT